MNQLKIKRASGESIVRIALVDASEAGPEGKMKALNPRRG